MSDRRTVAVHPNSMAARKWKRSTWSTTLEERELRPGGRSPGMPGPRARDATDRLFAAAATARKRGQLELAASLRAAAMRARSTEHYCG